MAFCFYLSFWTIKNRSFIWSQIYIFFHNHTNNNIDIFPTQRLEKRIISQPDDHFSLKYTVFQILPLYRRFYKKNGIQSLSPTLYHIFILTIKSGSLEITSLRKKVVDLQSQLFQNHDQVRYIRFKT